jgi:hypothetical protein
MLDRRMTATGVGSLRKPPDRHQMAAGGSVRVEQTRRCVNPTQRSAPTFRFSSTQPE